MLDLVPIELLFCKTNYALSKLIMWGLQEPVSHLAIDLPMCGVVVHSDLAGLHRAVRKDFLAEHTVVANFKIYLDAPVQGLVQAKLLAFVKSVTDGGYDFGAFGYFAWRAALTRFFNLPMPKQNPAGDGNEFLCTEAAYLLNEALVEGTGRQLFDYDLDLGAMSPWQLRALLIQRAGGQNEIDLRRSAAGSA